MVWPLAGIVVSKFAFWLGAASLTEAAVAAYAAFQGTETNARAHLDVEKTVGQFAREGKDHVERVFSVDDLIAENEYISGRLKAEGCESEAEAVSNAYELTSYPVVSRLGNNVCRTLGLTAGKDFWENKYSHMQSYARNFLGVEGKLSIAVNKWEKEDYSELDSVLIKNRPLVFKGGISFNEPGLHWGGYSSAETYFSNAGKFDTDTRKLAKELYLKSAHRAFVPVYNDYVSYLSLYEGALK